MIDRNIRAIKTNKTDKVLNQKKNSVSSNITDQTKILDESKLLNNKAVKSGLRQEDIIDYGHIKDMDLSKEDLWTYENLPTLRLNKERAELTKMPAHLKGCKKTFARSKWTKKQKGRISKAEKELKIHNARLKKFQDFKLAKETYAMQDAEYAKEQYAGQIADDSAEMLGKVNESLTKHSMIDILDAYNETMSSADKVLLYESDSLLKLETDVKDFNFENKTDIKDIAALFKSILKYSENPFTKNVQDKETGKITVEDLSASRYEDIRKYAQQVLDVANKLSIPVPQELGYILDIDNDLFVGVKDEFDPKAHANEAYILLMAAVSKVYYESLNRFAGYDAFDGINKYNDGKDKERDIRNFDILNSDLMVNIRNMRDMTTVYAAEIAKNRLEIFKKTATKEQLAEHNLNINVRLAKNAQPIAGDVKKSMIGEKEADPEEVYKQWEVLIKNDIRGVRSVDTKDMKQKPWVIGDEEYAGKVLEIMKADPDLYHQSGTEIKRYLISSNDNLHHNLLQLKDELPKTSVGENFCYVPKMRDFFIEKIKSEKFGMLLKPGINFRDLLKDNNVLHDIFDVPEFHAIKNRQKAIMKTINEALGINFFTDARSLESLWANNDIQALLTKKASGIFTRSEDYGISDKSFKESLAKIKATVISNIAIIDKKISMMGVCDTAKALLKRSIVKSMGGEYLLGYNLIAEDIVEYTIDNMMNYDGHAASIQRAWDKKFSKTHLAGRLSSKIENRVASLVNKNDENKEYYLRPQGFKTSEEYNKKWDAVDKKTDKILANIKKLYNSNVAEILEKAAAETKLTKEQWNDIENNFEDIWLDELKDLYGADKYSAKDLEKKITGIEKKVKKSIDEQIKATDKLREKLFDDGDFAALEDYNATLVTRNEFLDGLKNNPVITVDFKQPVIDQDIKEHIFNDAVLKNALKVKEDKELFMEVLKEELLDEKSLLHARYPYLEGVKSIEQLANLGVVDYAQFFADIKLSLSAVGSIKDDKAADGLLLDDWKFSGVYGLKKKLMKDFLTLQMTPELFRQRKEEHTKVMAGENSVNRMRFDTLLATDFDPNNTYLKFNYLNIQGKEVNQVARIKRINFAETFWKNLAKSDETQIAPGKYPEHEDRFTKLIQKFLATLNGVPADKVKDRIRDFGTFIKEMKITKKYDEGTGAAKWVLDQNSAKELNTYFGKGHGIQEMDLETLFAVQAIFKNVIAADSSTKKLDMSDCMGEMLLFGCGKEYFGAGGAGEKAFLDSGDDQYYTDIVEKSRDLIIKRQQLTAILQGQNLKTGETNKILIKLKPVIAGLKVTHNKKDREENVRKYGVEDLLDLSQRLMDIYGSDEKCAKALKESQEIGKLYLRRRDYIDNYGDPRKRQDGKFRVVRDQMMKDPEIYKKIMTTTDSEFEEFMKQLDAEIGVGLDVMSSNDFRGSMPINEQYVMENWESFKGRKSWTKDQWYTSIKNYHDGFYLKEINGKSVRDILNNVQGRMCSAGIDKSLASGTLLMKLTYILGADPASFALLYSEDDMFEAVKKIEDQYKKNMQYLDETMMIIYDKAQKNKAHTSVKEDDELYKEAANVFTLGGAVKQKKELMGSTKILSDLDAKREITEEDKVFADYSLLMQIMNPKAYLLNESEFRHSFLDNLKKYKEALGLDRNKNIYGDRTVLDATDKIRLGIEIRKGEGRLLQRKKEEKYNEFVEKKQSLGNIGLFAYNADPKLVTQKAIDNAADFVYIHLNDNYGKADPEFIKGLLAERVIAYGKVEEKKLSDYITADKKRLLTLDGALRAHGGLSEDEIKKAVVFAFAQNAIRKELPLDGTNEGDVKEILDELKLRNEVLDMAKPKSLLAKREYDEFMEEMNMARFTMSKEDFLEICREKKQYFELADICGQKIEQVSKDLGVRLGLFDYLKKDIFENINEDGKLDIKKFTDSINDAVDKLVGDQVKAEGTLSKESIQKIALTYLPDSKALMQHVSSNSVTAQEKMNSSVTYTRADIEKEIALTGRKDLIDEYNNLTCEEQKVFALVLTFPEMGLLDSNKLTSNSVMVDRDKQINKEVELQEQLASYIYGKDFAPKIDYNLVMSKLLKTDKKTGLRRVSKTIFDKAMTYTKYCIGKKLEVMPKDARLSDGRYTAEIGRELAGKPGEYKIVQDALDTGAFYGAKSFKEYFTKYADSEMKIDESVGKISKKLGKYNDTQMYMLLHILQDRTVVDYTTKDWKWDAFMLRGVPFVNEEKRDALKESLSSSEGMDKNMIAQLCTSVDNPMYAKAAATLFSFQLKDSIDLSQSGVSAESFAKGALKRATKIDWKLLERAMDLVDEIEAENLKIQVCRQTVSHTTDKSAPNKEAAVLYKEIDSKFKEKDFNQFDYFKDFLVREAKKNPKEAMPLISAFYGMSDNEQMLVVLSLKHRDILDVSTDYNISTAIGMNEDKYVNEAGRDKLADYYIEHLSVPGAKNVIATNQQDIHEAMQSLVSTQVSDKRDTQKKKDFVDLMVGKKIFKWAYIGADRKTGIDWGLFANALKFVRRTEGERKTFVGEAENYRATGNVDEYGRFMYNYKFLRKNLYRSGNRLTRFIGRRVRAELEGAIPGYAVGQRIMMACLSPQMRNKMLSTGIVKPGVTKNIATDYLGYAGIGGTVTKSTSAVLQVVSQAAKTGVAIGGESLEQTANGLMGIYNIYLDGKGIKEIRKPVEDEEKLKKQSKERIEEGKKRQSKEQQLVTEDNQLNKEWILQEVSTAAGTGANARDIIETATTCVNVLSGSSFGVQAVTNFLVGGIRMIIQETLETARFITSVVTDKVVMDKYFADNGPLGEEIKKLKGDNVNKIISDQTGRKNTGSRDIMDGCELEKKETEFMGEMSNAELFRKAYGFKDFSEQASFVGWHIVQTLLQCASPFGVDAKQFLRASLLLAAIGCKDAVGKQDNETAQRVYNRLMGQDIR